MYTFEKLARQKNFRYSDEDRYDKKEQSIYYSSYTSSATDLNESTYKKLLRHKELIDFSIKYVYNQLEHGFMSKGIVYPQELSKKYRYSVYNYASELKRLKDKKEKNSGRHAQKYWVYSPCVKTHGFRKDSKDSKFQAFVEFSPSYSDDETIKINLQMDKQGYKNRSSIYLDGFDLVFDKDKVNVRQVSEEIIDNVKDNNIEKFISIDCFSVLHVAVLDKSDENLDSKNRPRFNEATKTACCKYYQEKNTKNTRKCLALLKNKVSNKQFKRISNSLKQSIRAKVENCIGSDNESKVTILLNQSDVHRTQIFNRWFKNIVEDICRKRGIKFKIVESSEETVRKWLVDFKTKSNSKQRSYGRKAFYKNVQQFRTNQSLLYLIANVYKDFYPMLMKSRKSSENVSTGTDKKPSQVDKPKFPTKEEFDKQYAEWHEYDPFSFDMSAQTKRKYFVETIKQIAAEFYNSTFETSVSSEVDDFV